METHYRLAHYDTWSSETLCNFAPLRFRFMGATLHVVAFSGYGHALPPILIREAYHKKGSGIHSDNCFLSM